MIVETYARKVLNEMSNILGTEDVVDVCKIVLQALDSLRTKKTDEIVKVA